MSLEEEGFSIFETSETSGGYILSAYKEVEVKEKSKKILVFVIELYRISMVIDIYLIVEDSQFYKTTLDLMVNFYSVYRNVISFVIKEERGLIAIARKIMSNCDIILDYMSKKIDLYQRKRFLHKKTEDGNVIFYMVDGYNNHIESGFFSTSDGFYHSQSGAI